MHEHTIFIGDFRCVWNWYLVINVRQPIENWTRTTPHRTHFFTLMNRSHNLNDCSFTNFKGSFLNQTILFQTMTSKYLPLPPIPPKDTPDSWDQLNTTKSTLKHWEWVPNGLVEICNTKVVVTKSICLRKLWSHWKIHKQLFYLRTGSVCLTNWKMISLNIHWCFQLWRHIYSFIRHDCEKV